jgi:hypothetical protein
MRLQLTDSIFVTYDSHQYILSKENVTESGKTTKAYLGYYGTINHLVRGLIEKEIKSSTTEDLVALHERLGELETNITKQIKKGMESHV